MHQNCICECISQLKRCVSLATAHAFGSIKCTRNHCVTSTSSFRRSTDTSEASDQVLPCFASCSLLNRPLLEVRSCNPVGPKDPLCSSVPGGADSMNTRESSGFRDLQTSTRTQGLYHRLTRFACQHNRRTERTPTNRQKAFLGDLGVSRGCSRALLCSVISHLGQDGTTRDNTIIESTLEQISL